MLTRAGLNIDGIARSPRLAASLASDSLSSYGSSVGPGRAGRERGRIRMSRRVITLLLTIGVLGGASDDGDAPDHYEPSSGVPQPSSSPSARALEFDPARE